MPGSSEFVSVLNVCTESVFNSVLVSLETSIQTLLTSLYDKDPVHPKQIHTIKYKQNTYKNEGFADHRFWPRHESYLALICIKALIQTKIHKKISIHKIRHADIEYLLHCISVYCFVLCLFVHAARAACSFVYIGMYRGYFILFHLILKIRVKHTIQTNTEK
jgi:hypothetical protein